jgi:hypothetical protein
MINVFTEDWLESTKINNPNFEILNLGPIEVLIAKDFLKYPDKLVELTQSFKFFESIQLNTARPGKTFDFGANIHGYSDPFKNTVSLAFGANTCEVTSMYFNCFNGNMKTRMHYPHVDSKAITSEQSYRQSTNVVGNIGLTKDIKGGTGFWSYKGKINTIDMTIDESNDIENFWNNLQNNRPKKIHRLNTFGINTYDWQQLKDDGPWKLECVAPLEYNTYVLYSPFLIHNPYIETDWNIDTDRLSLATFFRMHPSNLMSNNDNPKKDNISKIWNMFRLNSLYNFEI